MNEYLQPDFYRFNEDSLKLVNWLAAQNPTCTRLLDLGAGSGVIGIELCNRLLIPELTLLEAQNDFIPFLEVNVREQLKAPARAQIIQQSFGEWKTQSQFDLIVSNPPYYLKGHGAVAPDARKQNARTFELDNWHILLTLIRSVIAPGGRCFIVVKNDQRILNEVQKNLNHLNLKINELEKLLILELSGLNIN